MRWLGWTDIHKKKQGTYNNNDGTRYEYERDTIQYVNTIFDQSPSFKVVNIDGVPTDVRMVNNREYQTANEFEQNLYLFRPETVVERGAYSTYINEVTRKEETWLIVFYHYHKIYPKAFARYCTKKLNFKNGNSLPAVVTNKISSSAFIEENKALTLPKDSLAVYVKATSDSMAILEGDRFVIDNMSFEVQSINQSMCTEDGVGVVELAIKKVPQKYNEIIEDNDTIPDDVETDNTEQAEVSNDGWRWE